MLLQFFALGVTISWDESLLGARASRPHNDGFPGARASRPHQARHSLGHLPHLDQPATAPCLSFSLAEVVAADRVAACSIALELSGGQRDRMRAGRPRSQGMPSRRRGSCEEKRPNVNDGVFQISPAPALPCGSYESETTDLHGLSGVGTCPVRPVCCIREHR